MTRIPASRLARSGPSLIVFLFLLTPNATAGEWPSTDRQVAGIVVDAAGKQVQAADIWLTTSSSVLGHVVLLDHVQTDAAGHFSVTVPKRWFSTIFHRQDLGLIAYKAGFHLAGLSLARSSVPPASGIRLTLAIPGQTTIQVQTPDKKPAAGAKVIVQAIACDKLQTGLTLDEVRPLSNFGSIEPRPLPLGYAIGRGAIQLPEELIPVFTGMTGPDGRATLRGVTHSQLAQVGVITAAHGTQSLWLNLYNDMQPDNRIPDTFVLQPVGSVAGRLKASNTEELRGIRLEFSSQDLAQRSMKPMQIGSAQVTPDAEGRFTVPALLVGQAWLEVLYPQGGMCRVLTRGAWGMQLKPGAQIEIELPITRAVRVTGIVRERSTGKPIAGVPVLVSPVGGATEELLTDDAGRYQCFLAPGPMTTSAHPTPPFFAPARAPQPLRPGVHPGALEVPVGATEFEVPPIELLRASPVVGAVVGDDEKPLAGATVTASWNAPNQQFGNWRYEKIALSNRQGEFRLEDVTFGSEVHVMAHLGDSMTAKAERLTLSPGKPLTLRVTKTGGVVLGGRVVDITGKPVAGATVKLWQRSSGPAGFQQEQQVRLPEGTVLRTDGRGEYRTPRQSDTEASYRVLIESPGYLPAKSPWISAKPGKTAPVADLSLHRLGSVNGRVIDRTGKPVANAIVLRVDDKKRTRTTTGDDGRFVLKDTLDGPGFLFVEKVGFRFHGQPHELASGAMDVVLVGVAESANKAMPSLGHVLSRKERLALASQVFEPAVKETLANADEGKRLRMLELLGRIDPARVLELIDQKAVKDGWHQDYLRRAVAKALIVESPDESRTVIDAMQDHGFRSTGYCDLADALPADKRMEKRELLAQALLHTRRVEAGDHQLVSISQVVHRLRECGDTEQADKLLRELQPNAKQLATAAWAGFARAHYAEELAILDLPAALELIKDLNDNRAYARHHGNIAHKLAAINPADAERVLGLITQPRKSDATARDPQAVFQQDLWAIRVCYRMAVLDLERATRIAGRIDRPDSKAWAFGAMAQALAKSQPAKAVDLLRKAFALLSEEVESGRDRFNNFTAAASLAAGVLVPVAEQIDPRLVPEFFWQALSFRTPANEDAQLDYAEMADSALALGLARYDRTVAAGLLRPIAQRLEALSQSNIWREGTFFAAATLVDPQQAIRWTERLQGRQNSARQFVAGTLLREGEELRRKIHEHLGVWYPDMED